MTDLSTTRPLTLAETEVLRTRQRARNRVMGLILGSLAILFFAISIVKIAAPPPHASDPAPETAAPGAKSGTLGDHS